jgi:hypothetical protein
MKPPYTLKVTYPIATVIMKIHSPAVVMRAPRSMVLAVCDNRPRYHYTCCPMPTETPRHLGKHDQRSVLGRLPQCWHEPTRQTFYDYHGQKQKACTYYNYSKSPEVIITIKVPVTDTMPATDYASNLSTKLSRNPPILPYCPSFSHVSLATTE